MLVVQKYGGTSVGSIDKIKAVAKRVMKTQDAGNQVVVVLSAMGGETDRLVGLSQEVCEMPDEREYDALVSTGENASSALLAMAIIAEGGKACSLQGHQVKVHTDNVHGKARIREVDSGRIKCELDEGIVVVVTGFQGIDEHGNITTLGRGGSDTSAVAIAKALGADMCEIYTDVEGVYTTDPSICISARKLEKISYEEMLELASLGAKVLQIRSVELAMKQNVPIHVRSAFTESEGTIVCAEEKEMENVVVSGVAYKKDEAKITVVKVPDKPGIAAKLFVPIAESGIVVDMIIQNVSEEGTTDLTFTVSKTDYKKAMTMVGELAKDLEAAEVKGDEKIAKVSVVGVGMRSHAGVAAKMFSTLSNEGINIEMISTSEIKVSCVIEEKHTELAVRVLHEAFELDTA